MVNIKELVRPNVRALKAYSSARDEFTGSNGVFLDANENPFGELNRYPDPYQKELKQKLSNLKNVPTDNIFIGNGSDEVIDLAFRIFCNPGKDKAIVFSPTYGMYPVSAAINDIKILNVPLTDEFQIDIEHIDIYFEDASIKLLFICSPNNPTGNLMNKNAIKYILKNFNGIVIIDEAYTDFSMSNSWISEIDNYPNLIVSQTFSKAWGLAAARIGVAYAGKDIIQFYNKLKPPYNVSKLNQQAAIKALTNTTKFEDNLQIILDEREKLRTALSKVEIVKKVYHSDANFLLIEVIDANLIYQVLVSQRIITRNRNNFVKNCIRISVGSPSENKQLIKALNNITK